MITDVILFEPQPNISTKLVLLEQGVLNIKIETNQIIGNTVTCVTFVTGLEVTFVGEIIWKIILVILERLDVWLKVRNLVFVRIF